MEEKPVRVALNLSVEHRLVSRVKAYAQLKQLPVSKLVEQWIETLPEVK